jgi:hypothetical protein
MHGGHGRIGFLHHHAALCGWDPQALKEALSIQPERYGTVLQEGVGSAFLRTADEFSPVHTEFVAR